MSKPSGNLPHKPHYVAFGLSQRELDEIRNVIAANPNVERAVVFGSRAKGNYHEGSDVDIALFGDALTYQDLSSVWGRLRDLELLLDYDVLVYHLINIPELREHIDRVGQVLWER